MTGVADQAVASATLLGLHLVLARLLTPEGFGAFALMVSAAMVGVAVVTALILDPLSVRRRGGTAYRGAVVLLLGALSLPLLPVALVLPALGPPVAALAVGLLATPGLGLLWLARRVAYLDRRPARALGASVGWAALVGAGVGTLAGMGAVSAASAATVVSGAGAVVGLAVLRPWPGRGARRLWPRVIGHHWGFGRWLLAGLPFWTAAMHGPLWLLAGVQGEAAAGAFRAVHLLGMPLVQLAAAVGTVHQPRLAARTLSGDPGPARRAAWRIGLLVALPAVPWGLLLWLWPGSVGVLLGQGYAGVAALAPLMVGAAGLKALATGPNLALRAARRGRPVFLGTAAAGLVAVGAAVLLIPAHGPAGAVLAFGLGAAANLAVLSAAARPGLRWRRAVA